MNHEPAPGHPSDLLEILKSRFEKNPARHPGLEWNAVASRLDANPPKLRALSEMERTGGEPDVIGLDPATGEIVFCDCSLETPRGRVALCYDRPAMNSRKGPKPANNALQMAADMGVELLTEREYLELQNLGEFDTKSSSWLKTPSAIRELGGAVFGDRRFGRAFIYHNGAQSYFSTRGFRAILRV